MIPLLQLSSCCRAVIFSPGKAETLGVSARVSFHLLLERKEKYSTFSPLSSHQCNDRPVSRIQDKSMCAFTWQLFDELRLSKPLSALLSMDLMQTALKIASFWVNLIFWAEATQTFTQDIFKRSSYCGVDNPVHPFTASALICYRSILPKNFHPSSFIIGTKHHSFVIYFSHSTAHLHLKMFPNGWIICYLTQSEMYSPQYKYSSKYHWLL